MAALAGLGAGSVVGGLTGALIGAGIPEYEAKRYEGRIRSGGILLSVHCEDDIMIGRAKEMLRHTGAQDVASAAEGRVSGGPSTTHIDEHRHHHREDLDRPLTDREVVNREVVHREVVDTPVVERDVPTTATPAERRVSDRIIIEDERPLTDTRRVVREEHVLTDEELRRRRESDPPPSTELL